MVLIENLQTWFTSNSSQEIQGIDTNSLNMTLEDFINTLTKVDQWDAAKYDFVMYWLVQIKNHGAK